MSTSSARSAARLESDKKQDHGSRTVRRLGQPGATRRVEVLQVQQSTARRQICYSITREIEDAQCYWQSWQGGERLGLEV